MNIAIDCRMLAREKSGIGHYLQNLLSALLRIDQENQYFLFTLPGGVKNLPDAPNAAPCVLHGPNWVQTRLFADGGWANKLSRHLPRRFDLVHEPGYEPLPLAPRTVLTIHDMILFRLPEYAPSVTQRYQKRLRESARAAALILADSESTRRDIIEILHVDPTQVRTALLGVDPGSFAPMDPAESEALLRKAGIEKPFLLSIGDLYRRKNNITLVRAFARLPEPIREGVQLALAGAEKDPQVTAALDAEIAKSGAGRSVVRLGYVAEPLRRALVSQTVALCYPTVYEGFGLPPLEAMAAGAPTLSSNNSSLPEAVGDAGILVDDYENPDSWAAALSRILTDSALRAELIRKGALRARAFPWERTAQETLRAYEDAVSFRRP